MHTIHRERTPSLESESERLGPQEAAEENFGAAGAIIRRADVLAAVRDELFEGQPTEKFVRDDNAASKAMSRRDAGLSISRRYRRA